MAMAIAAYLRSSCFSSSIRCPPLMPHLVLSCVVVPHVGIGKEYSYATLTRYPFASRAAARKTESSMGGVSRPVWVFWRLGWYDAMTIGAFGGW